MVVNKCNSPVTLTLQIILKALGTIQLNHLRYSLETTVCVLYCRTIFLSVSAPLRFERTTYALQRGKVKRLEVFGAAQTLGGIGNGKDIFHLNDHRKIF